MTAQAFSDHDILAINLLADMLPIRCSAIRRDNILQLSLVPDIVHCFWPGVHISPIPELCVAFRSLRSS